MALPLTTDQPDRTVAPDERKIARNFLIERMGSLLAFVPLAVWTAVHLWNQLAAFSGTRAIAYHLANGVWSFSTMGWGIAVSKSAQAWLERVAIVVFLVLLAIGWASIYALYQAGA